MNVYVAGYSAMFEHLIRYSGHSTVGDVKQADAVLFTGGSDVTPLLYAEDIDPYTMFNWDRDMADIELWNEAVELGIPKIGICRGAQFINVMCGGTLYQHISGHTRNHNLFTVCGRSFEVTSTHHQMLKLSDEQDYELIAWAEESTTPKVDIQPEVVYYNKDSALAVQYHPEYMDTDSEGFKYFTDTLIPQYIF